MKMNKKFFATLFLLIFTSCGPPLIAKIVINPPEIELKDEKYEIELTLKLSFGFWWQPFKGAMDGIHTYKIKEPAKDDVTILVNAEKATRKVTDETTGETKEIIGIKYNAKIVKISNITKEQLKKRIILEILYTEDAPDIYVLDPELTKKAPAKIMAGILKSGEKCIGLLGPITIKYPDNPKEEEQILPWSKCK